MSTVSLDKTGLQEHNIPDFLKTVCEDSYKTACSN